jgi:general secretion pathway protein B
MSTILDSLKKSSNKRDGQEKSSIDSFNFGQSKSHSKSGIIMILFLMLVTAITLFYGYRYINGIDNEQLKAETQKTENPIVTEQKSDLDQKNKIQKPDSDQVRKQLSEIKEKNQKQQLADDQSKTNEEKVEISNIEKTEKTEKNDFSNSIEKSEELANNSRSRMQEEKQKTENPVVEVIQDPSVPTQEYLYVYQLPFSVRKEIPKFILNIHIFDDNPENRVAVINGTKFEVDDLINEQVLVKEIVREGVLLEFNSYQFLIPIL